MAQPARTVRVERVTYSDGETVYYKLDVGRLGEFVQPGKGAPEFEGRFAEFEARRLPKGMGWEFIRRIDRVAEEAAKTAWRIEAEFFDATGNRVVAHIEDCRMDAQLTAAQVAERYEGLGRYRLKERGHSHRIAESARIRAVAVVQVSDSNPWKIGCGTSEGQAR